MQQFQFFSHQKIGDNAYLVTESYGPQLRLSIGVITGLEKTAVINAGLGISGSLRKYIEGFTGTGKPFVLYCTSGKPECIGAAFQFDEAFVSSKDQALRFDDPTPSIPAEVLSYGRAVSPTGNAAFEELRPGFLAIGRQHIMPRPFPGNTPGSFVILNGEGKLCFLGDAVGSERTILPYLDRKGIADYADGLKKLANERGGELRFYCGRSLHPLSGEYLLTVAKACEEIAAGQTAADLSAGDGTLKMHLYENAAVLYDSARME